MKHSWLLLYSALMIIVLQCAEPKEYWTRMYVANNFADTIITRANCFGGQQGVAFQMAPGDTHIIAEIFSQIQFFHPSQAIDWLRVRRNNPDSANGDSTLLDLQTISDSLWQLKVINESYQEYFLAVPLQ